MSAPRKRNAMQNYFIKTNQPRKKPLFFAYTAHMY